MAVAAASPRAAYTSQAVSTPAVQESVVMSLASIPLLEGNRTPPAEAVPQEPVPAILERIAWCESRGRQFDKNGAVLRGVVNPDDIGKFQINEKHWGAEAKQLGFNLASEEGNRKMAMSLFERYGTRPWHWSQSCWDKN
ncbi:MAG: hypothetical protein Q8Q94_00985 [bacterium]|nr:hypothetical protein [bacterium]MDZ4299614.1 hypothetical protein [Candidatus Sungbacteria bacterium]